MELIHIKTQSQYDKLFMVLAKKGFKPRGNYPVIRGDRYVSNEDNYLVYFTNPIRLREQGLKIIPFDQFIKEAI